MNLHISYKVDKTADLEHEFQTQIQKLSRRLQVFRPELVHLHAIVERNSAREGTVVSLNLRLPSGQMATQEHGSPAPAAVKASFNELVRQLTKHKEMLRGQRHRHRAKEGEPGVPFEDTVAAVHAPKVSNGDVSTWVDANVERLMRYIQRELRYRESNGRIESNALSVNEVLGETIAMALGNEEERPELLSLERWLYRLAKRAMDHLELDGNDVDTVHLEVSVRKQNVRASDEPQLQYHQPDEMMTEEDVIADRGAPTPEETVYSDEMVAMVETALRGAKPHEREAFILNAIEGFTIKEIAAIAERPAPEVEADLTAARDRLQRSLPRATPLRERLLRSRTA
jgi:DNA-directed RNA polymerase specialized sigma24 family protein/ribosome-associated translation inhibitor RaiA